MEIVIVEENEPRSLTSYDEFSILTQPSSDIKQTLLVIESSK